MSKEQIAITLVGAIISGVLARLSWMVLAGLYFIIFLKEGEPE